jgi:hypothetical protein
MQFSGKQKNARLFLKAVMIPVKPVVNTLFCW